MVINLFRGSKFNDLACIDNGDLFTHLRNDAQIMGDHQHRGVELFSQLLHHLQDLSLDRHIQRGRWLIGEKKFRLTRKRHGNDHTLLHAP